MCLAVPAKVVEIVDEENQIAKVEIGGVRRNISVALLDDVRVGLGARSCRLRNPKGRRGRSDANFDATAATWARH